MPKWSRVPDLRDSVHSVRAAHGLAAVEPRDLRRPLPQGWTILCGLDTGTYMGITFTLFPPDSQDAFVVYELPNYRYVGGEIELLDYSIPEWSREVFVEYRKWQPGAARLHAWCDENSQFKSELRRYRIIAHGNKRKLELRTEITREYFNNRRVWLAPWLKILPWELEHARWPDEATSAGRFEREKTDDHILDCVEHTFSRRPRHLTQVGPKHESFVDRFLRLHRRRDFSPKVDPHLGRH